MTMVVPPKAHFTGCADLVGKQGGHLTAARHFLDTYCAKTDGLENMLSVAVGPLHRLSTFLDGEYLRCVNGMGPTAQKIILTRDKYSTTEAQNAAAIQALYPGKISRFPDLSKLPNYYNVDDADVELDVPEEPDDPITVHLILVGGAVAAVQHVWAWVTGGDDLLARLITPITGEYSRLKYLHKAYDKLADATYTIAANLRKGSLSLASEWQGDAATAFDSYMFRWHMGIGGLGDVATMASKILGDAHTAITLAVEAVLRAINSLIDHEVKALVEKVAEMLAGDAAIEVVGLGPEDPVADVVAGVWTADRMYEIYKLVKLCIVAINGIMVLIEKARKLVSKLEEDLNGILQALSKGVDIGELINDFETRGFEFEKSDGWKPAAGAARIALLPPS